MSERGLLGAVAAIFRVEGRAAFVEVAVGEQVVVHDYLLGHVEGAEQQRYGKARVVLAVDTTEHDGIVVLDQQLVEHRLEGPFRARYHGYIEVLHEEVGIAAPQLFFLQTGEQVLPIVESPRQVDDVVEPELGAGLDDIFAVSEVDKRFYAHVFEPVDAACREGIEFTRTEYFAPTQLLAVFRGVSAQISEVFDIFQPFGPGSHDVVVVPV